MREIPTYDPYRRLTENITSIVLRGVEKQIRRVAFWSAVAGYALCLLITELLRLFAWYRH